MKRAAAEVEHMSAPDHVPHRSRRFLLLLKGRPHMSLLPDEQRELLLLVALQGLTYKEAADALGIPIGTVMSRLSRLSRARASLRTYLEGNSVVPLRRPK